MTCLVEAVILGFLVMAGRSIIATHGYNSFFELYVVTGITIFALVFWFRGIRDAPFVSFLLCLFVFVGLVTAHFFLVLGGLGLCVSITVWRIIYRLKGRS